MATMAFLDRVTPVATLGLVACAPCALEPAVGVEHGHAWVGAQVEHYVRELLRWTGPQCLARVEITEQAPELGLSRRGLEGWELWVHPAQTSPVQINRHVCALVLREQQALAHAPSTLFQQDGQSREARFLDVCQQGPLDPTFLDLAQVCALPPHNAEEVYVQDVVFGARVPPQPQDLEVTRAADLEVTDPGSRKAYATTGEGLYVLVGRQVEGEEGYSLDRYSVRGREHIEDLPTLTGRQVHPALGVDSDYLALLVRPERGGHELLRVDRQTGAETWRAVSAELAGLASYSPSALLGDELVLATGVGVPGRLYAVSVEDGSVRSLVLPAPEEPELLAVPSYFWPDPQDPHSLLVSYHLEHLEPLATDATTVVVFDRYVARVDVQTGAWTTLFQTGPWGFGPLARPLGVTDTGLIVLWIEMGSQGALLGALDTASGALRVSGSDCLAVEERPTFVIGQTAYAVTPGEADTERWRALRLARGE
jgi:hypothetical protein